jgi:hypothetical protein
MLTALLAVMGNALLPFVQHPEAVDGKILICTAEGYRYIDAANFPKEPVTPHKPHCVLCVLASVNPPLTPSAEIALTLSLKQLTVTPLPEQQLAVPLVAHTLFISRAPPVLS